jgi:hypothetical protein
MPLTGSLGADAAIAELTNDVIVLVPGIMGSRLVEASDHGRAVWDPAPGLMGRLLGSREERKRVLDFLTLTDEELEGRRQPRVVPKGLIKAPCWFPHWDWVRPYAYAISHLSTQVSRVEPFAYDWRFDINTSARALARHITEVVARWRGTDQELSIRKQMPDSRPGGVILVAHSMGGLVVRALLRMITTQDLDGGTLAAGELASSIHGVVEVGVPRRGSPKAVWAATDRLPYLLTDSEPLCRLMAPLTHGLAKAAARMPGLYDLLPTYPVIWSDDDVTHLDRDHLTSWGADGRLVDEAATRREDNRLLTPSAMKQHFEDLVSVCVAGDWQPTVAMIEVDRHGHPLPNWSRYQSQANGEVIRPGGSRAPARVRAFGDGTVPNMPGDYNKQLRLTNDQSHPTMVQQRHVSLMSYPTTLKQVEVVANREAYEPVGLGTDQKLGLDPPPLALAGEPVRIEATGVENLDTPLRVLEAETGTGIDGCGKEWIDAQSRRAAWWFNPQRPGVYEIQLGMQAPVTEMLGVVSADE